VIHEAIFPGELEAGIVVFTGERITSASARHILGEESSRVHEHPSSRNAAIVAIVRSGCSARRL